VTRGLISTQSLYPYVDCFSQVTRVDYTLAGRQRQKGLLKEDFELHLTFHLPLAYTLSRCKAARLCWWRRTIR